MSDATPNPSASASTDPTVSPEKQIPRPSPGRWKRGWSAVGKGIHVGFDGYAWLVQKPFIWGRDVLTFVLQRLLYEESTFAEVRASKYRANQIANDEDHDSADPITKVGVATCTADPDALLAIAERKASEADDRYETVQAKARFQLTLCGLLLAAIWSLSDAPLSLPAAVAGLAFVAALFLLLRVLQTGSTTTVEVQRRVFEMEVDVLKRYHASRLMESAAENNGRLDFLVGVQRTAARAIHVGLIGVVWLGAETAFDKPTPEKEASSIEMRVDSTVIARLATLDSLVGVRVDAALDTLGAAAPLPQPVSPQEAERPPQP